MDDHAADRLAIAVDGLHEIFRVYHERPPGLKERLYRFRRSSYTDFHALRDVSLRVRHGECVALIGHNGSGKSTLLKCIARILPADRGTVRVNGRLATLLELGAGFHQDLTGRENIFLNGAILGLTRRQIEESFDSIVDFADVWEFIDTPVRNYSSGMYVRLGFAIAVHVDPDILVVDEVLSVGDAAFQEKSLARMRAFKQRGKTVVLVSHDLSAVAALCERTVVLDHGRVVYDGATREAIEYYEGLVASGAPAPEPEPEPQIEGRTGDFRARISEATFVAEESPDGSAGAAVPTGAKARVELQIEALDDITADGSITVGLNVRRPDMQLYVYETRTSWRGTYLAPPRLGCRAHITFNLNLQLLTGTYLVDLLVANASTNIIHDRWLNALEFEVAAPEHEFGVAALDAGISVWNPDGYWPPELHAPTLERGGPREHPLREGDPAPAVSPVPDGP